jgi:hypothetical protein
MFNRVTTLELIDRAFADQRRCAACGAPTILRAESARVLLECSDPQSHGILGRLGDLFVPHTRQVVLDPAEELAA